MNIRRFQPGDEPLLLDVYFSAIHMVAVRDYTDEQINAWAPKDIDQSSWATRIQGINPFVVELCGELVGYADVQASGYIDHFFVSGHHSRIGVGALLMNKIHSEAKAAGIAQFSSDVSRTAEPFFKHYGFTVVENRNPVVRGVCIPNSFMRKLILCSSEV